MSAPLLSKSIRVATPGSEIIAIREFLAAPEVEWDAIAARPSEANSFAERWFVEASVRNLDVPPDLRMLVVREEGQLIGLMPIMVAPCYGRTPVHHVENWLHFNAFFGTPLVRRAFEPFFWSRALALLDEDAAAPNFLHIVALDADGPVTRALLAARRGSAIVHRIERAMLASDLSPAAYYEANVRKKKRKEIGRLRSRLNDLGIVSYERLIAGEQINDWADEFLALEASGWKGRDGSALANDRATAAFLRSALHGAFASGRLDMLKLTLDGRALAMLINFISPPGSYSFKIAFDEAFARFSPGVLIQLENLEALAMPGLDWMDSCAAEGHPMIDSLWSERRTIVRVTVPLKGKRRRATFSTARMLETVSALTRRAT